MGYRGLIKGSIGLVTASHCVDYMPISKQKNQEVKLYCGCGCHHLNTPTHRKENSYVCTLKRWETYSKPINPKQTETIAVGILENCGIDLTKLLTIPSISNIPIKPKMPVTAYGFGMIKYETPMRRSDFPTELQSLSFHIVHGQNNAEHAKINTKEKEIMKGFISAISTNSAACLGDSGGPLMDSDGNIIAVVFGNSFDHCEKGEPDWFTPLVDPRIKKW